jgi:SAM-dependent methyltransferase
VQVDGKLACRSCGAGSLWPVIALGNHPLANALLAEEQLAEPEPRYPLDVVLCAECGLLQITVTVQPEILFRDYFYLSSYSDTFVEHARVMASHLIKERGLGPDSLVVELASNDGYLLQFFVQAGIPVLGIDPAKNVARVAESRGVPTLAEFFGTPLARDLRSQGCSADIVIANNVLAHVADLNGFVEGIATILRPGGIAQIEVPYVVQMIDQCEFDTIYHEHLCYFSLTSLQTLFARHGLVLCDVEQIPLHGGSLRVTAAQAPSARPSAAVANLLEREQQWGVTDAVTYARFAARVDAIGQSLRSVLTDITQEGKAIAAYGAAAKGTVLLNTFGIGRETIDFVVDRNTHKQGRYMPGVHIPIRPPERLLEDRPEYLLLLAWNFADEIMAQQAAYQRLGGRFIIPIPEPQVT